MGLEYFADLFMWERDHEIESARPDLHREEQAYSNPANSWVPPQSTLSHLRRLFATVGHLPHGRAS
jgi:hypothetical protein